MRQTKKNILHKKENPAFEIFDIDKYTGKYIWALIPVMMAVYYVFRLASEGFYQDDELTHLMYLKRFFHDPGSIIGQWNKAGYKLLLAFPSLLGFEFVYIFNIFLTALIPVCIYYLCKHFKIKNATIAALLFAFQPLIYQLSFRCYSEMLAGLLIILALILYYRKNFILSALCSTYLFTVRYEHAVLSFILGIMFIIPVIKYLLCKKKKNEGIGDQEITKNLLHQNIIPFLLLALGPVILNIAGYIKFNNPFWLLSDVKYYGLDLVFGERKSFWHYFETYIFIIGPVTFTLLIIGMAGLFIVKEKIKENIRQYGLFISVFIFSFLFQVVMAWDILSTSSNQGQLRLLLPISPLAAVFAGLGLNLILEKIKKTYIYFMLVIISIIVLFFLSWDLSAKTLLLEENEYIKLGIVISILISTFLYNKNKIPIQIFISIIVILGSGYTILKERPIKIDPEKKYLKLLAEEWKEKGYAGRNAYCNNIYFYYAQGIEYGNNNLIKPFNLSSLKIAAVGSICIWDWHYSDRIEYNTDTPLEFFNNNRNFRLLGEYNVQDPVTREIIPMVLVFEKIKEY